MLLFYHFCVCKSRAKIAIALGYVVDVHSATVESRLAIGWLPKISFCVSAKFVVSVIAISLSLQQ